jgi:hypothetical protein
MAATGAIALNRMLRVGTINVVTKEIIAGMAEAKGG